MTANRGEQDAEDEGFRQQAHAQTHRYPPQIL
jgi:hypothetical protein